jgi:hypothetical protein
MRPEDKEVQKIARQMGMLYMNNGKEYSQCITVGKKEFSFQYSNPEEHAYVDVDSKGCRTESYLPNDFDQFRLDYPTFF